MSTLEKTMQTKWKHYKKKSSSHSIRWDVWILLNLFMQPVPDDGIPFSSGSLVHFSSAKHLRFSFWRRESGRQNCRQVGLCGQGLLHFPDSACSSALRNHAMVIDRRQTSKDFQQTQPNCHLDHFRQFLHWSISLTHTGILSSPFAVESQRWRHRSRASSALCQRSSLSPFPSCTSGGECFREDRRRRWLSPTRLRRFEEVPPWAPASVRVLGRIWCGWRCLWFARWPSQSQRSRTGRHRSRTLVTSWQDRDERCCRLQSPPYLLRRRAAIRTDVFWRPFLPVE